MSTPRAARVVVGLVAACLVACGGPRREPARAGAPPPAPAATAPAAGATPQERSCQVDADCVVYRGCCDCCRCQVQAVNRQTQQQQDELCARVSCQECADCPACPAGRPNFLTAEPVCASGLCSVRQR